MVIVVSIWSSVKESKERDTILFFCVIWRNAMNESDNPSAIRSKKQITDALLRLMEDHPYEEITVKQIVLETDLVRKTFYRNFSSKDDVLNAYIYARVCEYCDALLDREDPLTVVFEFCEKNRRLLELLNKHHLMHILLLRLNEIIPALNENTDLSRNPFKKLIGDLEPDYLIAFNIGAIWNVIFKWVERGMSDPVEEVRDLLRRYIEKLN